MVDRVSIAHGLLDQALKPPTRWRHYIKQRLKLATGRHSALERLLLACFSHAYDQRKVQFGSKAHRDTSLMADWKLLQSGHRRRLKENFANSFTRRVCLGNGVFSHAAPTHDRFTFEFVDLAKIDRFEAGTVYLLNSNDVQRIGVASYIAKYLASPDAVVAIWDFDNHHALDASFPLAAFCDYYVPCHSHNSGPIALMTDGLCMPVSAGTIQWTRTFLAERRDMIVAAQRSEEPLGRHIAYKTFPRRNAILTGLNAFFRNVGPVKSAYHALSDDERLREWVSHMSHWIAPTFNDIPLRIFDALATGGIPIVPVSLAYHPSLADFRAHIVFYDECDLADPRKITQDANDLFIRSGVQGILERHTLALEKGHVDQRLREIVDILAENFRLS